MLVRFLDGTPLRVAELRRIVPALQVEPAGLPSGYATSAPDPGQRAHDMVRAVDDGFPCLAESCDLTRLDGSSLRLELDSENDNRFCRYWRETPVELHLAVALRRSADAPIEVFRSVQPGRIADKPAGPRELGWDRLFVPDGFDVTLAELVADPDAPPGDPVGLRARAYQPLVRALES
ncbi:MAG TPA: non-canonical purine NTP pyrophosphatase [Kofleriaceae bacterium]|nr:non-canonical purine NTP pyrophosphatase [Kofleriaceae bacterium]